MRGFVRKSELASRPGSDNYQLRKPGELAVSGAFRQDVGSSERVKTRGGRVLSRTPFGTRPGVSGAGPGDGWTETSCRPDLSDTHAAPSLPTSVTPQIHRIVAEHPHVHL